MVPLAIILLLALSIRSVGFEEAAQTSTAGLITLIPEGLVLLMSVTLAVAAVRLAKMNTLVQQMSATEALAAVDTICVDKTGTLTDGTLDLVSVEVADPQRPGAAHEALGRFAHSAGERNRTLEVIAERYPGAPAACGRGGPVLLGVEVERADAERLGRLDLLRDGRPGHPRRRRGTGALACPPEHSGDSHARGEARRRVRGGGGSASPGSRLVPAAAPRGPGAGRPGGAPAPGRDRNGRVHASARGRPEADLGRRPLDRDGGRARGRHPPGRRGDRGTRPPRRPSRPGAGGGAEHDLLPHHARAEEAAGGGARRPGAVHRDDRRRRERRAGA